MTFDSMFWLQDLVNQQLLQLYQLDFHLKAGRLGECHQHHFGAGLSQTMDFDPVKKLP